MLRRYESLLAYKIDDPNNDYLEKMKEVIQDRIYRMITFDFNSDILRYLKKSNRLLFLPTAGYIIDSGN